MVSSVPIPLKPNTMFQSRQSFDAVVLNGLLYAIGGNTGNGLTGKVERYTH